MNNYDCGNQENTLPDKLYNLFDNNTKIANDEINSLQAQFRLIHIKTQLIIIIAAFCFEFFYYFIAHHQIHATFRQYFFRYVFIPFAVNISLYIITKIYNKTCNDTKKKNYFVILSSLLQTFFYIVVHQLFATIYAGFLIMIFLSTVYSDKTLTRITAILSLVGILLAVFMIKYDKSYVLTSEYFSDFLVITFILIMSYITAECIIRSNKSERLKILQAIHEKEKYWYGMMVDELSGLYSRAALRSYVNKLEDCEDDLCIVMLDIDNFKKVNDTYGHQYGDKVISILGYTLNTYSSSIFRAFRYGGEEFLVIIQSNKTYAEKIMNESKDAFNRSCLLQLKNPDISFSAGISVFAEDTSIADTIGKADAALYKAKNSGKNKVVILS